MSLAAMGSSPGPFTVTDGENFTFSDSYYGTYMEVTFTDDQIILTNLIPGIYPVAPFSGVDIKLLSGPGFDSVTEDALSSPLFAPGSILTYTSHEILINLSGTCVACVGAVAGLGGENIVLDVATGAVTEPASWAMMIPGFGLIGGLMRRRRAEIIRA